MRVNLWEPAVPSAGFTVDTPLGPVDLVAVGRAYAGHQVALNEAELTWLSLKLGYVASRHDREQIEDRRRVAEALGLTTQQLSHRIIYRLRREGVDSGKAA